ncbi:MAG: DegV family protein [Coriobacteriales bacterium]|nr:DegV family protein [Coriobacteriales bacterium]
MAEYILMAETGSDIHQETARRYGIAVVPMHVNFGEVSRDDDSFPPEELYQSYKATGKLPQTAGCSPQDFTAAFDRVHQAHPDAQILYLAYSAATTVSFRSAHLAAEGRDYVTMIDTKAVSSGQRLIVTNVARMLQKRPDATKQQVIDFVNDQVKRIRFAFVPGDLDYLRAGGRLSNVAFLGATLLRIKPTIEVIDGKLVATTKRRGTMVKCVRQLVEDFVTREPMDLSRVNLTYTSGDAPDPQMRSTVEKILVDHGAQEIEWVKSGCVIASHSGPGSFGIAALVAGKKD